MKSSTLKIRKSIAAPWTEETRQKLIVFWSERRFRFSDISATTTLTATRGNILWNLVSYDMTRLRADLSINATQPGAIDLTLVVHTTFQQITEWNRAFWDLEMATCESFLLRGDTREAEWIEFTRAHRRANIIWTFTLTLGGRKMPKQTNAKPNA